MKINVFAFGSHHIAKGFPRFVEQAKSMETFDQINTLDQRALDVDFKKLWGRYLVKYSRGYGYWCWKPYLILKELEKLEDGDILLYSDIGCFFNPKAKAKFQEYIKRTLESETGILGVRSYEESYNTMPETVYYEHHWTKGDVFEYFGVQEDSEITHTTQFESTIIFFKKSDFSMKFVRDWYKAYLDDYTLATDSPSRVPNFPGFVENRHDQSIYSILAKKYNIESFSTNEIFQRNWNLLEQYPIWAMRDKAYPSKLHYRMRFRIRKFYAYLWKVKYFFKDMFCGVHDQSIRAK